MKNIYEELEPILFKSIAERLKTADKILEIGAGKCDLVHYLAERIKKWIVGVDINPEDHKSPNRVSPLIHCIKGDAHSLTFFKEGVFNSCVSLYTLHHLEHPIRALREIYRVLKGGGECIIIDFIKGSSAEELWGEEYYTPGNISSFLKRAGFSKLTIEFPKNRELVWITGIKKEA